ncbi:MAG: cytochrome c oxidase subunit II [Pseudomonadota bacterium]
MKVNTPKRSICYILLVGLIGVYSQNAWSDIQPYNMPEGVTEISHKVFDLHMIIFYICCVIGVLVFGAMAVTILRDRKSKGVTPAKFHESTFLEFLWTAVPFAILIGIAIPAAKVLIEMEDVSDADMTIKVTGYQWLWRYEYIDHDIDFYSVLKTSRDEIYNRTEKNENYLLEVDNELVLPTNRKVRILLTSNDVLHAWWVPDLALKKDAIPGYINQMWTEINEPGIYRGQCAELCGRDHGFMPVVVRAIPPEEFDAWAMQQNNKTVAKSGGSDTSLQQGNENVANAKETIAPSKQDQKNIAAAIEPQAITNQ